MPGNAPHDRSRGRFLSGARELFTGDEASVAQSVLLQFFVTIALPVLVVLGLPTVVLFWAMGADPRLWQALIAGLVIATGWLTTAIFAELGKRRGKAERLRDYHKAIYAEIGNAINTLYDAGAGEAYGAQTVARMEGDAQFVPLVPREHHDHIYDAVLDEIEVLPRQTIDAIVSYYSLVKAIAALAEDMRGERFLSENFGQPRRIAMYSDYLEMRKQAFLSGQYALKLIKLYSEGGREAAEDHIRLSNPDAGRSDRLSGSE